MRIRLLVAFAVLMSILGFWIWLPDAPDADMVERLVRERVRTMIGLPITVRGGIEISLFPTRRVILKDLEVGAGKNGGAPVAVIDQLEATLVGDLGEADLTLGSVKLVRPRITLEIQSNGQSNWENEAQTLFFDTSKTNPITSFSNLLSRDSLSESERGTAIVPLAQPPPTLLAAIDSLPDSVQLEQAVFRYRNYARGLLDRVTVPRGTITRAPSGGSFAYVLEANWRTIPLRFEGHIGTPRPDGVQHSDGIQGQGLASLLELQLTSSVIPGLFRYDGIVSTSDAGLFGFQGLASLISDEAGVFFALLSQFGFAETMVDAAQETLTLPGLFGEKLQTTTRIESNDGALLLSQIRASIGAVIVTGEVEIGFPSTGFGQEIAIVGALEMQRIDLDPLLALSERRYRRRASRRTQEQKDHILESETTELENVDPSNQSGAVLTFDLASETIPKRDNIISPREALLKTDLDSATPMLIPPSISGAIDLIIGSIIWRGRPIHDIHVLVGLRDGLVGLDQASLQLPGAGEIVANGEWVRRATRSDIEFSGAVHGQIEYLQETLAWLGLPLSFADTKLRRARFVASLVASQAAIGIEDLSITIDDMHAQGRVNWYQRDRPALEVALSVDRLNLDTYLASLDSNQTQVADKAQSTRISARMAAQLRAEDGDKALPLGPAKPVVKTTVPGLALVQPTGSARSLTDLRLFDGLDLRLDIDADSVIWRGASSGKARFSGNLRRGEFRITEARLSNYVGSTMSMTGVINDLIDTPRFDGRFRLMAQEAAPLLRSANLTHARSLGHLIIEGTATGALEDVVLDASLSVAQLTGELKGSLRDPLGSLTYDMALNLQHPDMTHFTYTMGYTAKPLPVATGPLQIVGRAVGSASGAVVDLQTRMLGGVANFIVQLSLIPDFAYQGQIRIQHTDTNEIIANLFPGQLTATKRAGPLQMTSSLAGDATGFELTQMVATLGETNVTGQMAVGFDREMPLVLADLQTTGPLDTGLFLSHHWAGFSRETWKSWPDRPIDFRNLVPFVGKIALEAESIAHHGYRLADVKLRSSLDIDKIRIDSLTGNLAGGSMGVQAEIRLSDPPSFDLLLVAQNAAIASTLGRDFGMDLRGGDVALDVKLGGSGARLPALMADLSGSILFEIDDLAVGGVDSDGLSDTILRVKNPQALRKLVRSSLGGRPNQVSKFEIAAGSLAFEKGVVTLNELVFISDLLEGKIKGTIDLGKLRQDLTILLGLPEQTSLPIITLDLTGPTASPERKFNLNEMTRRLFGVGSIARTDPAGSTLRPPAAIVENTTEPFAPPAQSPGGIPNFLTPGPAIGAPPQVPAFAAPGIPLVAPGDTKPLVSREQTRPLSRDATAALIPDRLSNRFSDPITPPSSESTKKETLLLPKLKSESTTFLEQPPRSGDAFERQLQQRQKTKIQKPTASISETSPPLPSKMVQNKASSYPEVSRVEALSKTNTELDSLLRPPSMIIEPRPGSMMPMTLLPQPPLPRPSLPEDVKIAIELQKRIAPTSSPQPVGGGLTRPGMSTPSSPTPSPPSGTLAAPGMSVSTSPPPPSGTLAAPGMSVSTSPPPPSGTLAAPGMSVSTPPPPFAAPITPSAATPLAVPGAAAEGVIENEVVNPTTPLNPAPTEAPMPLPKPALLRDEIEDTNDKSSPYNFSLPSDDTAQTPNQGESIGFGTPPLQSDSFFTGTAADSSIDSAIERAVPAPFRVTSGGSGTFFSREEKINPSTPVILPLMPWQKQPQQLSNEQKTPNLEKPAYNP